MALYSPYAGERQALFLSPGTSALRAENERHSQLNAERWTNRSAYRRFFCQKQEMLQPCFYWIFWAQKIQCFQGVSICRFSLKNGLSNCEWESFSMCLKIIRPSQGRCLHQHSDRKARLACSLRRVRNRFRRSKGKGVHESFFSSFSFYDA
jgi:hypothetical protein